MTRRWQPRRQRRRDRPWTSDLGFILTVALVGLMAFYVTLNWSQVDDPLPAQTAIAAVPAAIPGRATLACAVASINDGDTLRCRDGTRIRLHAVAAREADETCSIGHPCPAATAASATHELTRLAAARTIRCQPTGRSYDRVTAICWTPEGEEINCAMIRSGTALVWEKFERQAPLCRGR